jgi:CRISPR-associated endonuclease/helicase Cas3
MQRLAGELPLGRGPQLLLIEDATGSGKTEAALLLAARLMAAGLGEGLYFALPTMATANAIHGRLSGIASQLFADDPGAREPSVILSHGKAQLAAALARLEAIPSGDGEETTAASCNDWISDDRRRAFFADVGAGTIDQAFLAVLPKKHLTLRQYALAGRILIIDEAHCFDAYMKEELGALLRLHAMNGGSAIVLSATLARNIRRQIARSYYEGLGFTRKQAGKLSARCASTAYPLLTHITRDEVAEHAPELDARLARTVAIERLESREDSFRLASDAADLGAAVLVICNAVDEAIVAHEALTALRPEGTTHLFHARFAQGDRVAIEDAVLARFGREAEVQQRGGHVLVATQVVEQSLDLDFDLVVSDLAPIDLLIQRAGRLWRHMDIRPTASRAVAGPKLLIVSPDPSAAASADWLVPCLGRAAYVYRHAGVMWRTARTIFARAAFAVPDDLRPMIEAVYGESIESVPPGLEAAEIRGEGQEGKEKALGGFNVVDLAAGYGDLPSDLRADEDIGTRLGEATVTIRLARRKDGALVPWFRAGGDAKLDWALSELRVRKALWGAAAGPAGDARLHDAARKDWTEWERHIAVAEVEVSGQLRVEGGSFSYTQSSGLRTASAVSAASPEARD